MKFETLYKKTSTGKPQFWMIYTVANTIFTHWGQVGGKEQAAIDEIKEGKNLGKANATTASQQAEAEALSQWEKKLKKGYVKNLDDANAGKIDDVIEGGIFPMLAHKFSEQGHKIKYPAFVQPKFDGHRCIAVIKDGKATLWSRTRKQITGLPHIVAALENAARLSGTHTEILDGELYSHDYRDRFEELSSFIRQVDPKPGHEVVQYHIYDLADEIQPQGQRFAHLRIFLDGSRDRCLVSVPTREVDDEDEMMLAFEEFLRDGYEGLMVRNATGLYVNKRSADLQKVKEFDSSEFEVVGVEEGRGKLAGHAILVCKTCAGVEFRVKMKGETAKLKEYFEHPERCVGHWLEVKYQGITTKSGVPRFPIGLRFRDDL